MGGVSKFRGWSKQAGRRTRATEAIEDTHGRLRQAKHCDALYIRQRLDVLQRNDVVYAVGGRAVHDVWREVRIGR